MDSELTDRTWRKASRSQANGACIEVATLSETRVAIRDSNAPAGPHLLFDLAAWRAFAAELKRTGTARRDGR